MAILSIVMFSSWGDGDHLQRQMSLEAVERLWAFQLELAFGRGLPLSLPISVSALRKDLNVLNMNC